MNPFQKVFFPLLTSHVRSHHNTTPTQISLCD